MWAAVQSRLQRVAAEAAQCRGLGRPSAGAAPTGAALRQHLPLLPGGSPGPGSAGGALKQQVRYGPKDGRPGRLEHHRFGCVPGRGRFYYRFHKIIGKWNWRGYQERYIAPRALENRQRWIPTTYATYRQMKHSKDWYWRLPKAIAAATTPDQVLEAWNLHRHKHPKKTYHYFKVLQRLTDVGMSETGDWRLQIITSRMNRIHRKVLNLPRLAKFYAQLKATNELEHMVRFMYKMLPKYPPQQLVLAVHSFGMAKIQDKRLFSEVARLLEPGLPDLSPTDLVRTAQAYAATEVCHYSFLLQLSAQAQVRVHQASIGTSPAGSCPTFLQLTELAEAFAQIKLQDYSFMEMCTTQAEQLLAEGMPGPTPPALARLCTACAVLKVHEVRFFETVLAHISEHWYDYPAVTLAEIGVAVAPALPQGPGGPVRETLRKMLELIGAEREELSLSGVALAVQFMAELDSKADREFVPGLSKQLAERLLTLRDDTQERYDVARVTEVFSRRCPENRALFSTLCRHLHRHLGVFQPVDFVRFLRGLSAASYRDERVVHATAKWARKRAAEFSPFDWDALLASMGELSRGGQARAEKLRSLGRPLPAVAVQTA